MAQTVKRLPAMRETRVRSPGREDPLEKEMATHSSILGLENFMDGRAWWATVHGVAKSRTRLSDFASLQHALGGLLTSTLLVLPDTERAVLSCSVVSPWTIAHHGLCDRMDYSPPGSSVQGILQVRILEWLAMPSSRGSSQPRFPVGEFFTIRVTRETIGNQIKLLKIKMNS